MNNPGSSINERNAAMTRGIIVWVLLMGLVSLEVCQWRIGVPLVIVWISLLGLGGLLWALVFNIAGDDDHAGDKQQGSSSLDHHDGEEPHNRSLRHSKAT
jgi:hypothetical protein